MEKIIEITHLQSGYGKTTILKDISLEVYKGEFLSIIGPNGTGKTTLFRTLTGELRPQQGSIRLYGKEMRHITLKNRARQIAIVNQHCDGVDMRVFEYVRLGRLPYRRSFQLFENDDDITIADEAMKLAGIWEKREMEMSKLSGGERQLVSIAKALAQKTQLLLLDEPTSNLDIAHQMKVLNLLQRLNQEQKITILLIIHDLNLASEYSDRLILLYQGKIHSMGPPEEVLTFNNLEAVYQSVVLTHNNPLTGKPFIFPVSANTLKKYNVKP